MAHLNCEEKSEGKCKNRIYRLDLFERRDTGKIVAEETIIIDTQAKYGHIWGVDYSYREKKLFVTDVLTEKLRREWAEKPERSCSLSERQIGHNFSDWSFLFSNNLSQTQICQHGRVGQRRSAS